MPRLLVDWLRSGDTTRVREVPGTLAFADISGFTKLTERLARKGKVGAEEMNDLLDDVFTELLEIAYRDGAGLIKWGGDAVLLLFEGEDHAARACRAAHGMRRALRERGRMHSSAGFVSLRMSVGIHTGVFHFFLVGDAHRELIIAGPDASRTVTVESQATAGEILLSAATAAELDPVAVGRPKEDGFLLRSAPDVPYPGWVRPPDLAGLDLERGLPAGLETICGERWPPRPNIAWSPSRSSSSAGPMSSCGAKGRRRWRTRSTSASERCRRNPPGTRSRSWTATSATTAARSCSSPARRRAPVMTRRRCCSRCAASWTGPARYPCGSG